MLVGLSSERKVSYIKVSRIGYNTIKFIFLVDWYVFVFSKISENRRKKALCTCCISLIIGAQAHSFSGDNLEISGNI